MAYVGMSYFGEEVWGDEVAVDPDAPTEIWIKQYTEYGSIDTRVIPDSIREE